MHLTTTTANRKPNHSLLFTAFWSLLVLTLSTLGSAGATLTVTNVKDSGADSLRAAIEAANSNGEEDTINFDPAFFNVARTITLTSGEIPIGPDGTNPGRMVTINGPGANLLTISGGNASRIFLLGPQFDANVTMNGMTLRDGNGVGAINGDGGAIFAQVAANLTLNSMVIRNNVITAVASGGGMSLNTVTSVVINDSLITENSAYHYGGLYVGNENNTFTMRNTIVSNNRTIPGDVGGIGIVRGTVDIRNCQITGNQATGSYGGASFNAQTSLNVSDTVVANNTAAGGVIGGIYTDNNGGVATFRRVTISNNSALAGNSGGISIRNVNTIFTIIDSTVSNNSVGTVSGSSNSEGGGISVFDGGSTNGQKTRIINTTISGNSAGLRGGGIYNFSNGLELINSTVVNNSAGGTNFVLNGGGGIFDGEILRSGEFGYRVKLQNSIIAGNTASSSNGPDIYSGFDSSGYNIIGNTADTNGSTAATGDQFNVDPLVGPLADNGGATLTHALLPGSPAIDKGKSADVMTDQRALPRPYNYPSIPNATGGDGSDIGALEDQPPNTAPGNDVTVEAPAGDASITFNSVTQAGFTTFAEIVPPSSAGTPPAGYTIVDDAPAYDINTTAIYTAPITVCFTVDSITDEAEFARVRILHGENGVLVDRTDLSSLAFASRTVCAQVDSLSPFVIALAPPPGLLNISTRLQVLTGDQVLIGGFIVTGTDPKMVILRAIGPSLSGSGIPNPLADPVLELRAADGSLITTNDNWTSDQAAIEATGLQPSDGLESAIVATLDPGSYTAIMSGKNGGTGVGLVEAYDLDQSAASELANISTRGFVETESNVMIGGFILDSEATVVVRAIGPTLSDSEVADALEDPTLELRDVQGTLLSSNDNWKDTQQDAIEGSGLAPQDDLESALLEALPAGAYTAIVAGQAGGTGVGLVEVYRLP